VAATGGWFIKIAAEKNLEYETKYGEDFSEMFSEWSLKNLDSISNKLEEYKVKRGKYPENLSVLKGQYPELDITDPLLNRNPEAHSQFNFYYRLSGEKYALFSSGVDCIPNTADDIFPSKKTSRGEKERNLINPLFAK
jgi:hypothetical protein